MSGSWYTEMYFPRASEYPCSEVRALVGSLVSLGYTCVNPVENTPGTCFSLDGRDLHVSSTIEESLDWLVHRRGGSLQLWFPKVDAEFSLIIDPCGINQSDSSANDTVPDYGTINVSMDYTYLRQDSGNYSSEHYWAIFRLNQTLVQLARPIYGWGDLERYRGTIQQWVNIRDLRRWSIPRVSWWSYYSKEYLEKLGLSLLATSVAWLTYQSPYGLTTILHPPGEPASASRAEQERLKRSMVAHTA